MIIGGWATSPAESGHALSTALSGALPFLLCRHSKDTYWSPVAQYNEGGMPAEESYQVDLCCGDTLMSGPVTVSVW